MDKIEIKGSYDPSKRSSYLSRRKFLVAAGGAAMTASMGCARKRTSADVPIRIGLLHSLSGTMAISEAALRDAALMAVEEINREGGVLGRPVEPVIENAASDPLRFRERSEKLLAQDKVSTIFGCWTSISRKAVLPVLEKYNGLLWYPVQYEGDECSPHVIYTGLTPNQQIITALDWLLRQGRRRFYLAGSDYVFPRTANRVVKLHLQQMKAVVAGEEYVPLGDQDFAPVVQRIRAAMPDVVFSTINGDSNLAFYKALRKAGIRAADLPVMATSIAEAEVRRIGATSAEGHLATWSYFQSIDTPANRDFVDRFKNRYGARRVTDDPIETGYFQVHLWAQAVKRAGSIVPAAIRASVGGLHYDVPEGQIVVDPVNHHTWRKVHIGRILGDGQFEILHSSADLIQPDPWILRDKDNNALCAG